MDWQHLCVLCAHAEIETGFPQHFWV